MTRIRRWLHDHLGWGYPDYQYLEPSYMPAYGCQFCEQVVTADSQGNWFHLPRRAAR